MKRAAGSPLLVALLLAALGASQPAFAGETIRRVVEKIFAYARDVEDGLEKIRFTTTLDRLTDELVALESGLERAIAEAGRGDLLDEGALARKLDELTDRRATAVGTVDSIGEHLSRIEVGRYNARRELAKILEEIDSWTRQVRHEASTGGRGQLAAKADCILKDLALINCHLDAENSLRSDFSSRCRRIKLCRDGRQV